VKAVKAVKYEGRRTRYEEVGCRFGVLALALSVSLVGLSAQGTQSKSPVADAAARGDRTAVQALIAKKADVNATQGDGATALHWAAFKGDREMAQMLVSAGAKAAVANRNGSTPLWLAAINGDAPMIALLLRAGADANEKLPLGRSPLMIAARTGSVDAIKALLEGGADVNAKDTQRGTTPLMWAADEGHEAAIQLLIERGADVSARSNPAPRGGGPALGKSNDPRKAVAAQAAAVAARQSPPSFGELRALESNGAPANANAGGNAAGGRGGAGGGRAGGAGGAGRGGAGRGGAADGADDQDDAAVAAGIGVNRRARPLDGGGLTALVMSARANDQGAVKALLDAGANVNQQTLYGWTPLLVATQNRNYKLGAYLIERGADVNLAHNGGWTPLYLATDNRNIENGDYPVRKPDMDHLEFIRLLIDKGANVNHRVKDSTETRTVFTNQWLDENGATAFLRASQSGDVELMKLLLSKGADPKINTALNVSPLHVAAGIGWVEGVTYEWSAKQTLEAVKMLLDLGLDVNLQADTGRTALHGAAHKGHVGVIQALYDKGAKLDVRDYGNTDNRGGKLAAHTFLAVDYADGLVRVGVQSAIPHPEAGLLMRKLMEAQGMKPPPMGRTLESICITDACE
jgi:ankyrin repeat protein